MRMTTLASACAFALLAATGAALAEGSADPKAVKHEGDKYFDAKGDPTYNVQADGTVDWATYSGFRRYHSECHVCHGPNAEGSSYAPALKDSLKTIGYQEFYGIVVGGREHVDTANDKVMPAFGDNKNVMCYLNDIYTYIRARSTDAVGPGRPMKREDKDPATTTAEDACLNAKD
jgi:methanol metabolism-related c-type cytochrome